MSVASSTLEIHEGALRHNLRFLRSHIGPGVAFCSVVKGNAYGHDVDVFVPLAEALGVRRFAVASAAEALEVVRARSHADTQVMIMGDVPPEAVPWVVENDVSAWVFDVQRLEALVRAARALGRPARIHLELETGLNRTGVREAELDGVLGVVREAGAALQLDGLCTHFAGAESVSNYVRIQRQIATFQRLRERLSGAGLAFRHHHTACSAAALTLPQSVMDLVRVGIAQYGFWPSRETRMHYMTRTDTRGKTPLRRVLRWTSRIMSLTRVPAGEFAGYGTSYLCERDELLAVVPVGYADGYPRKLSNLGQVLIHSRRAPVVGNVNMSVMLVRVTHLEGVRVGDEVVLLGKQGRHEITVSSFSEAVRQVDYETLTQIRGRIPRVVVGR